MPDIDEDAFQLEIGGLVNRSCTLSMKDLKDPSKFPCVQFDASDSGMDEAYSNGFTRRQKLMTVTLQCSGTRRIEQIESYPGDGDELINAPWGEGAM